MWLKKSILAIWWLYWNWQHFNARSCPSLACSIFRIIAIFCLVFCWFFLDIQLLCSAFKFLTQTEYVWYVVNYLSRIRWFIVCCPMPEWEELYDCVCLFSKKFAWLPVLFNYSLIYIEFHVQTFDWFINLSHLFLQLHNKTLYHLL